MIDIKNKRIVISSEHALSAIVESLKFLDSNEVKNETKSNTEVVNKSKLTSIYKPPLTRKERRAIKRKATN